MVKGTDQVRVRGFSFQNQFRNMFCTGLFRFVIIASRQHFAHPGHFLMYIVQSFQKLVIIIHRQDQ
jgi:hypothetical protein